jgi:hypothetical protein
MPWLMFDLLSRSTEWHRNTFFFIPSDFSKAVEMPPLALNSEVLSIPRTEAHHSIMSLKAEALNFTGERN